MAWQMIHAEDLKKGDVFLFDNERDPHMAHLVSTPVVEELDSWVRFCTHNRWSDSGEGPSVVEGNTEVYVLRCSCNGMSFICNRWVFTGQCGCVHIPRPKLGAKR